MEDDRGGRGRGLKGLAASSGARQAHRQAGRQAGRTGLDRTGVCVYGGRWGTNEGGHTSRQGAEEVWAQREPGAPHSRGPSVSTAGARACTLCGRHLERDLTLTKHWHAGLERHQPDMIDDCNID